MAIVRMVPYGSTVMDIGCGAGQLGKYLWKNRGCTVSGADIDPPSAMEAISSGYHVVQIVDLDEQNLSAFFPSMKYDVVILADILEHVKDPLHLLDEAVALLSEGGILIISVPNIVWLPLRLKMVLGHFDYEEYGPLDATHLRFFTARTIEALVDYDADLSIIDRDVSVKPSNILMYHLAKLVPGLFAYQIILKCKAGYE